MDMPGIGWRRRHSMLGIKSDPDIWLGMGIEHMHGARLDHGQYYL